MKLRISFSRLGKYCNLIACPGKSWRIKYLVHVVQLLQISKQGKWNIEMGN